MQIRQCYLKEKYFALHVRDAVGGEHIAFHPCEYFKSTSPVLERNVTLHQKAEEVPNFPNHLVAM